ncbi:MAG: hypothetical protein O3A10_16850 [Chloroflexi bacterium]|nr:hypothetical protein [Chloroflexota bacterium]MDA1148308.1 hypothetical protein [Chloroflexota bacterium]
MNWLPDDVKEASGGETIDHVARDSIRLAHKALDRFPDLVRRHKVIAGGAAISSSLIILAGVAIAKRMHRGETAEQAVAGLTEEELQQLERVKRRARVTPDVASPEVTNGVSAEVPPA